MSRKIAVALLLITLALKVGADVNSFVASGNKLAEIQLPDVGVSVSVAYEWERRAFVVTNDVGQSERIELISDWGPPLRTNLYRVGSRKIGILDFGDTYLIEPATLAVERWRGPMDNWLYVGTFLNEEFIQASEASECMDILRWQSPEEIEAMKSPEALLRRSSIYKGRC